MSPQRVHKFSRVCTAACIVHRRTVSFGGSGLLMTAPKHFEAFVVEPVRCKVRRRCDNCISLDYFVVVLVTATQRMHDGWSKLISNFHPPIKAAPQQCPQKAHFKFSRVCTACEDFPFGGTLGETFEAFAI